MDTESVKKQLQEAFDRAKKERREETGGEE